MQPVFGQSSKLCLHNTVYEHQNHGRKQSNKGRPDGISEITNNVRNRLLCVRLSRLQPRTDRQNCPQDSSQWVRFNHRATDCVPRLERL